MPQENKNVAVSRAMGDGVQGALEVVCGVAVAPSLPVEDLRAVLSGLVVELDVGCWTASAGFYQRSMHVSTSAAKFLSQRVIPPQVAFA